MDLSVTALTVVTLAERNSPSLGQWLLIIIGGSILAGVLFIVALIAIIGGHRFSAGAKFLWILGVLPWPVVGPLVYLLVGRNMRFIKPEVAASESGYAIAAPVASAPAVEPPAAPTAS
jgi:hypothetical protein